MYVDCNLHIIYTLAIVLNCIIHLDVNPRTPDSLASPLYKARLVCLLTLEREPTESEECWYS